MRKLELLSCTVLLVAASGTARAGSYEPLIPPGGVVAFAEAKTHSEVAFNIVAPGWGGGSVPQTSSSSGTRSWQWQPAVVGEAPDLAKFSSKSVASGPDMAAGVSGYASAYANVSFGYHFTAPATTTWVLLVTELPTIYGGQSSKPVSTWTINDGSFPAQPGAAVVSTTAEVKVDTLADAQGGHYVDSSGYAHTGDAFSYDSIQLQSISCNGNAQN